MMSICMPTRIALCGRAGVLGVILAFLGAGCASPRQKTPATAPVVASPATHPTTLAAPATVLPPAPTPPPPAEVPTPSSARRESPLPAAPAAPVETPAARVADYLPQGLVVLQISDSTLLVKRISSSPPASLFEESIALNKLRGQLKSRPSIPRGTAEKSRLQDGTASIAFAGPLPAAEAAGAISAALSLDGIQRVRAVLVR